MSKYLRSPMFLLYTIAFTSSMSSNILNPIISVYARNYAGASVEEVGIIISIFSMASLLTKMLSGFYLRGTRILYIPVFGSLMSVVSFMGIALFPIPLTLMFFRAIQGLGDALTWSPILTLVVLLAADHRREEPISRYFFAGSLGMFFGPIIGFTSVSALGTRNTFLLSVMISAVSLFSGVMFIHSRGAFVQSLASVDDAQAPSGDIRSIFRNRSFRFVLPVILSVAFIYGTVLAYGTLYSQDLYHLKEEQITLMFFGYNGVVMISRFFMGRLTKRVSKGDIMAVCLVNCTLTLLLLQLSPNYLIYAFIFSLLGVSHGLAFPVGATILAETTPRSLLAMTNTIYNMAWDIGNFLGPITTAPLVAGYAYEASLIAGSIVSTAALIVTFILKRRWKFS